MIYTYKYSTGHDKNGKLLLTFFRCKSNKSRRSKSRIFSLFSLYPLKTHPNLSLKFSAKSIYKQKKKNEECNFRVYSFLGIYEFFCDRLR